MLVLQPRLDFGKAAKALGGTQAGVQLADHRTGDDPKVLAPFVVHPQKPVQAKRLVPPGPGRDGRQTLAEQGGQLAPRGRQPGLMPVQELQPLLFPHVSFLVQQIGKVFFGFDDGDVHKSIAPLINEFMNYNIALFCMGNILNINGISPYHLQIRNPYAYPSCFISAVPYVSLGKEHSTWMPMLLSAVPLVR